LINSAVHKLEHELSNYKILIDIQSDFPLVKMDFGLIEQALVNILHNAAIYTPSGSEIRIHSYVDGNDCMIVISDSGPGFPPDSLMRIFEKFYRVPGTQSGGSGLGLSIAKGFVEAHKGTIKVENRVQGGAQFTMKIPAQHNNQSANEQ
jgi:two-component system, OmpR family, sensor histidine kinase KdpD